MIFDEGGLLVSTLKLNCNIVCIKRTIIFKHLRELA